MQQGEKCYRIAHVLKEDGFGPPLLVSLTVEKLLGTAEAKTKEAKYQLLAVEIRGPSPKFLVEETVTKFSQMGEGLRQTRCYLLDEPLPGVVEVLSGPQGIIIEFLLEIGWADKIATQL